MGKINKIIMIEAICMIIAGMALSEFAYAGGSCLRVPIGISEERRSVAEDFFVPASDKGLELRQAIRHDMGKIRGSIDVTLYGENTHSEDFIRTKKSLFLYIDKLWGILNDRSNVNWESDFRNAFNEFVNDINDGAVKILCKELNDGKSNSLKDLIDGMKLFYKSFISADETKVVDLERLFRIVGTKEASRFIKKNKLHFEGMEDSKYIIGKEGELYRAFLNLARNSVEAIKRSKDAKLIEDMGKAEHERPDMKDFEGRGVVNVKVSSDKGYSVIEISDNGPGMSKEALEAFTNRTVYSSKGELGGRGLKTARDIIERNGGTIDIRSEPGKGTTFIIRLPSAQKSEDLDRAFITVVDAIDSLRAVSTAN